MSFTSLFNATNISASGLSAERLRMEVIANNIANAHSTRDLNGDAFRRQNVVFEAEFDRLMPKGVRVVDVTPDTSELPRVYRPGHPDADADGMVTMPNVQVPNEMVDLITASRGYEANLRVLRSFREMVNSALEVLRRA